MIIRNIVLDPGFRCIVSGVAVLCFPLLWRARQGADVWPAAMLVPVRWFARLIGAVFVTAGVALVSSQVARGSYHGAQLILVGASAFPLADILARLVVGRADVALNAGQIRRLWRRTTSIGLTLILGGALLHMAWHQLP